MQLGKPVLVEKPIGFSLREADMILDTLRATKGELRVGYSRRYKECFLRAKEQMVRGRLGKVVGGMARVYNSRAQAFAILKRDPHATPVLDVLTYYVDLMCWFLEGNRPVEVVARGQHGIFKEAGYGAHDVTWAILTFADGAVINLGVSYALPARYPTLGQSDRVELLRLPAHRSVCYGGRLGGGRFLGPARQRDAGMARSSRHRCAHHPHDAGAGAHQSGNDHRHRARGGLGPDRAPAAADGGIADPPRLTPAG